MSVIKVICCFFMSCLFSVCEAGENDFLMQTVAFVVPGIYRVDKSRIAGSEYGVSGCSKNGVDVFTLKGDSYGKYKDKVIVVKSRQQLDQINSNDMDSRLLKQLSGTDFSEYSLALFLATYTGLQHLENERLYQKNRRIHFGFEVWNRHDGELTPKCERERLYVIKLKK